MTSQTGTERFDWRRAVIGGLASGALAAALLSGFAAPTAFAQPADTTDTEAADTRAPGENCTGDDCAKPVAGEVEAEGEATPKKMSADEALSIISAQYAQGDGGGQVSKLIDDAMKLRARGFRPSSANAAALADALDRRPHQTPLVEALRETIAYQRKLQAQAEMSVVENGPVAGPVPVIPSGTMTIPLGP